MSLLVAKNLSYTEIKNLCKTSINYSHLCTPQGFKLIFQERYPKLVKFLTETDRIKNFDYEKVLKITEADDPTNPDSFFDGIELPVRAPRRRRRIVTLNGEIQSKFKNYDIVIKKEYISFLTNPEVIFTGDSFEQTALLNEFTLSVEFAVVLQYLLWLYPQDPIIVMYNWIGAINNKDSDWYQKIDFEIIRNNWELLPGNKPEKRISLSTGELFYQVAEDLIILINDHIDVTKDAEKLWRVLEGFISGTDELRISNILVQLGLPEYLLMR